MAAHLSDVSCPFPCRVPLCHSVCSNNITGDAANHLATVVLEHAAMTDFCGIPLASLRENSITELDLQYAGVGVPGVIVLSKLLPSAAALTSLKCAPAAPKRSLLCQRPLTLLFCHADSLADNALFGVKYGQGTYTTEGITKLCEALKGSAVTSLKCAAGPPNVRFRVSAH